MKPMKRMFHEAVQRVLTPDMFHYYNGSFYRVSHDVLQLLCLFQYQGTYEFSFDIQPLSLGIDELYTRGYGLSFHRQQRSLWWTRQELISTNFQELIMIIEKITLPIFRLGIDAKTAYQELTAYEKTIYTGIPGGIIMNSGTFVLLCIQANDYDQAEKHMAAIVAQNRPGIEKKLERNRIEKRFDEEWEEELRNRLRNLEERLQKIQTRDTVYWERILEDGTAQSLEFLTTLN